MSGRAEDGARRDFDSELREGDVPDFAEEHSRPTFEDEPGDLNGRRDESTPKGPAGEAPRDSRRLV